MEYLDGQITEEGKKWMASELKIRDWAQNLAKRERARTESRAIERDWVETLVKIEAENKENAIVD